MLNSALLPIYKTTNHNRCNCEMSFRPVDLGRAYYPRYLHAGFCQPNSCEKYYQCVEKKYYVKVLRKKEFKDGEDAISSSSLPKALRNVWMAETFPVGVACECVIDFQTESFSN
ncbi:unnamed protein product [Phyllotreta striolata]|uniref:Prothoracicotropic hormone n=1 Tax=Phyllotreta striolata TaxID=444603 RepID=A0A9N9TTP4_PHYSR|nr:unnamed protein product [Phyllotreta striolata]